MATRTISTRLAIEGENEYRQALKNCNNELSTMKSELARVQSQYQGNANSLEALTAKGNTLNAMYEKQQEKVQATQRALDNAKAAQAGCAAEVDNYKSRLSAAQSELERLRNSTGNTTQEQRSLEQQIGRLSTELQRAEAAEQAAARGVNDWTRQNNYAQRDLNNLSREIGQNNTYLDEARNSTDRCARSIDEFGREVRDAGNDSDRFGQRSSAAIDALSAALAASGVVVALNQIKETLVECTKSTMQFEAGMAEVYTLLPGESKEAYQKLSGDMVQFSGDMNVLTEKGVPALYQAISAGVSKDNVFDFLSTAQKAAVGGVAELETSVDGLTSIVNAYGEQVINAAQTSDMLFTAVRLGKTDFKQLSGSIYNVVPTAAAAKIGFDNVAAALAVITAQGVPTSVATTQLRQMFVELSDSGSEVGKTFEAIAGQSFKRFIADGGNVQQALQKLESYAGQTGMGINELFSSVEAGNSALSLTGQATDSFARALEEMKNSAGATDQAYETMTQTAEYAAQQLQVSFHNVKIAIGDALLPALTDLSECGASALQWAGVFIEQNPWIVSTVSAVAASLGVLTVAITGYTVATKVLIPLVETFNIALGSNPAGQVALAVSMLVTGLTVFVGTMKASSEQVKEMSAASTEAATSLGEIRKTYDDTVKSTEATAKVAGDYIDRLKQLEEQGLKTDKAHMEYEAIVNRLQAILPDLNITLDEQTGLIKDGTAALEIATEAWKNNAAEQAYQEKYSALLSEQGKVTVEVAENQVALQEVEGELLLLEQERSEILEQMSAKEKDAGSSLWDRQAALSEVTAKIQESQLEQRNLSEAIEAGQKTIEDYNEELEKSSAVHGQMTDTAGDTEESLAALNTALSNAQAVYGKLAKEAEESIDKQIGTWDEMDNKTKTSIDTLNKALESQITYLNNYSANLESLSKRNIEGIDQLVASLSDGSKESAAILAGMAGATDEEIKKVIQNMGKVKEGKTKFSETVAGVSKEFKDEMAIVVKESNKYKEMYSNGSNAVQGLIDGAEKKRQELIKKYKSIAKAADAAAKKQLGIQSPSKVFAEIGSFTIEGMIQGIQSKENALKETMEYAVDLAIASFGDKNSEAKEKAKEFLLAYNDALKAAADNTKAAADELKGELGEITKAYDDVAKKQEDMQKKLSEYGDLFTVDSKTNRMKLEDLDLQINKLNQYSDTINSLKENGISQGLLDEVIGMNVDDAIRYGDKLLEMADVSPEKWEEYNAKWEEKQNLAKEIAREFYTNELDALKTEYNDKLMDGLEVLKGTSFDSGVDTVQGLMDGMKSKEDALYAQARGIANEISRIINSALSGGLQSSSDKKKKSGSHALGLDYVPYDGYMAELHRGERVLTADETRAYIAASTPSSFSVPAPEQTATRQAEAMVNAVGTLISSFDRGATSGDMTVVFQVNGTDFARATIEDFRNAADQSPRVESDFK